MQGARGHAKFGHILGVRHPQAMLAHVLHVRRPRVDESDILTRRHHVCTDVAADGAGADARDPFAHPDLLATASAEAYRGFAPAHNAASPAAAAADASRRAS